MDYAGLVVFNLAPSPTAPSKAENHISLKSPFLRGVGLEFSNGRNLSEILEGGSEVEAFIWGKS